jgi:hypothetical protein
MKYSTRNVSARVQPFEFIAFLYNHEIHVELNITVTKQNGVYVFMMTKESNQENINIVFTQCIYERNL